VTFFESWQIWLQYFCFSGAIQLQAGCAHFFGPVILTLLAFRNPAAVTSHREAAYVVTPEVGCGVFSSRQISTEKCAHGCNANVGHISLQNRTTPINPVPATTKGCPPGFLWCSVGSANSFFARWGSKRDGRPVVLAKAYWLRCHSMHCAPEGERKVEIVEQDSPGKAPQQSKPRANKFTIASRGVTTLKARSMIHPTDAAPANAAPPIRNNGYARAPLGRPGT
jgi:hypothetical protein